MRRPYVKYVFEVKFINICSTFQVELENTLEQEQEALVNRLWKRMDKLEAEKRSLQIRLDQPVSDPASPR